MNIWNVLCRVSGSEYTRIRVCTVYSVSCLTQHWVRDHLQYSAHSTPNHTTGEGYVACTTFQSAGPYASLVLCFAGELSRRGSTGPLAIGGALAEAREAAAVLECASGHHLAIHLAHRAAREHGPRHEVAAHRALRTRNVACSSRLERASCW